MSSRESPSIPSKWRLLSTNEDLWAMFIKAEPIGAAGGLGKDSEGARSRGPQACAVVRSRRQAVPGSVMAARIGTDEVSNQSPPYQDVDLFGSDTPLREAVAANGAGGEAAALGEFGRHWGSAVMFERAKLANENPPRL